MGVAPGPCPIRQLGVHALAVNHQRCKQADVLAPVGLKQLRGNAVGALGFHRRAIKNAMLCAQLDKQQAQKMPDFGRRADGGLDAAARQALLNSYRGRNAIHRIDFRSTRGLHDAAGIGIERLQIAPLAFVEQNIKRQGGFARAAHAGHYIELTPRNIDGQALQIVLFGVDDLNQVGKLGRGAPGPGSGLAGLNGRVQCLHFAHRSFVRAQCFCGV